ncbi:hypothetical protein [Niallia circulans]|uniref:Uncharacterized protein n=1 Tax=Niallia circulans TaxID=1397 RepID=A0A941JP49_NIACI|nr:hypothetical protein [Niallia circulans]MCB5238905.1 hypothetical protein [Niallia circulans]
MTKFLPRCKDIEGAKELLEQVENDVSTIDASIAELKAKREELEKVIEDSKGKFTVGVLTGKINAEHELKMLEQTLLEAEDAREKMIGEKLYRKAEKVILEHRERVNKSYDDMQKAIIEKLYELRFLYRELIQYDNAEYANIKAFTSALSEYFPDFIDELNLNPILHISQVALERDDKYNTSRVIDMFPETAYGVEGGLFQRSEKVDHTTVINDKLVYRSAFWNKKYGINPTEIKEKFQREREEVRAFEEIPEA